MLLIAPGCSSRIPTVPTVSIDPDSSTCLSTARASSEAARPASFLLGMRTAPACPPFPSNSTFRLAGAAMAVTMPIDIPSSSRIGPCSMCSSIKAEYVPFFKNTLDKSSPFFPYPADLAASRKDMF
ncbi:hypothetical protein V8G54_029525 [Vigna mungo]|uniref:Uncharacterized protein n=1 Tax=Vigna mungo TaxID=3915 RepID=A0AAQ3MTJ0_VIGMU